jgi:hypothetical protein
MFVLDDDIGEVELRWFRQQMQNLHIVKGM